MSQKTIRYLNQLIGVPIVDNSGNAAAKIIDFILALNGEIPCLAKTVVIDFKTHHKRVAYRNDFSTFSLKQFVLNKPAENLPLYEIRPAETLATELWDKSVVDTASIRTVDINDLVLEEEPNGKISIVGIDISTKSSLLRRKDTPIIGSLFLKLSNMFSHDTVEWGKIVGYDDEFESITSKLSNENLQEMHPADLADIIEDLDEEDQAAFIENLDEDVAAEAIAEVDTETQVNIIERLDTETATDIIEEMAPDEAADLLQEMDEKKADEILKHMDLDEASDVKKLLEHDEYTAGGIMTTEYIAIYEDFNVKNTLTHLRLVSGDIENIYYMYVVDKEEKLKGVISIRDIFTNNDNTPVVDIMDKDVLSVPADMPQEEVAAVVSKYDYFAIPVVDKENKLLGVITVDDVMDVMEEEATEDIFKMAGTSDEELEDSSAWQACKSRLPWLLITLCTGFVTSWILKGFTGTFEKISALVFFVPVVTAMGGNTGVQSSTLSIRGIALNGQDESIFKSICKELLAGAMMGSVCGFVIGLWAQYIIKSSGGAANIPSYYLSMTVGLAMMAAMAFAATFGAIVPTLFGKFKIDPAVASGPFVTSLNDIFALIIYYAVSFALLSRYLEAIPTL